MDIQYIISVIAILVSTVYIIVKVFRYLRKYPNPEDLFITNMLSFITSFCVLIDIKRFDPFMTGFVLAVTGISLLIHLVLWFRVSNPKLWDKFFDRNKIYQERKDKQFVYYFAFSLHIKFNEIIEGVTI